MTRKLEPGPLVIASHNAGKIKEITALVAPFGIETTSAKALGFDVPDETGTTYAENAAIKARAAAKTANAPALSDDSGLSVAALGGAPGVYSADWAGDPRDFGRAMDRVETALQDQKAQDLSAKFICALCLAWPDGHEEMFQGEVLGHLTFPGRGDKGFGYDPIFVADGYDLTFGEMEPEKKHAISHRADAFAQLVATCLS
ncbi:MAG: RdgB/HAM1 family non-canonical purine NTP pyrophosphatase [Pseudomonadota bacterium]